MVYRLRHQRVSSSALGYITNISRTGAFFTAGAGSAVGDRVVLKMEWPVDLDGVPLSLIAQAHVVRSDRLGTAVKFISHEFHTRSCA